MTDTTLVPIKGTFLRVQPQYLHDSPTQPRDTYDEAYLDELAESIKANGDILSDLLIRKRMSNPLRPLDTWTLEDDGYETIYGHCRKRAGGRAGLADLPCKLVEMTDEQVQKAQLAENLNRKGLTFIEEAETLAKLKRNFSVGVPELMAITGKKQTYVYNQLKLADACPEVKEACKTWLLQEYATKIARIPAHTLQVKALEDAKRLQRENEGQGQKKLTRDVLEKFSLNLKDALFSLDDAELVPSAGACKTCPSRSGANPELYGDVASASPNEWAWHMPKRGKDICMNPECFGQKKAAQLALDAKELVAQGKTVVTGGAAKAALTAYGEVKGAYVAVKDVRELLKQAKGAKRPETVLIQDQRTGKTVEAVKKADLAGQGVKVPNQEEAKAASRAKSAAALKKIEEKTATENAYRRDLFDDVRARMRSKPRTAVDLCLVAELALHVIDYEDQAMMAQLHGVPSIAALTTKLQSMPPDDIGMVIMDCLLLDGLTVHSYQVRHDAAQACHGTLQTLAAHHGVDLKAHRAAWDAAKGLSTPLPAAQAQGKGAAKKPNKAVAGGKAGAIPAAPGGGPCGRNPDDDRTLELPLDEVESQPATPVDDVLAKLCKSPAMNTAAAKAAWPFKDRQPPAADQSNDAGVAGDTSAAAGRKHDEETEA